MTDTLRLDDEAAVLESLGALTASGGPLRDSLLILLAAADSILITSVVVDDIPPDPPRAARVRILGPLLRRLRDETGADGAALVILRPGSLTLGASDLAWRDAFTGAIQTAHLDCHGGYVVTASGTTRIAGGEAEAA